MSDPALIRKNISLQQSVPPLIRPFRELKEKEDSLLFLAVWMVCSAAAAAARVVEGLQVLYDSIDTDSRAEHGKSVKKKTEWVSYQRLLFLDTGRYPSLNNSDKREVNQFLEAATFFQKRTQWDWEWSITDWPWCSDCEQALIYWWLKFQYLPGCSPCSPMETVLRE